MKKLSFATIAIATIGFSAGFSAPAYANKFTCVFTEPFLTVTADTAKKKVSVEDSIEQQTQHHGIRKVVAQGNSIQVVFGAGQEELTSLRMNLDFNGSDGMSERIFPYSAELQTGDTRAHHGGCYTAQYPMTESVLDCVNLEDGASFNICQSSLAIECKDSAKQVVAGVNSMRSGKAVEVLKIKEILYGKRYSVKFRIKGSSNVEENFVTTSQARHGSSCGAKSVEAKSSH